MPTQDSYRRHKHRKKTDEKLDLNELSSAPNLGGMLSFLAVPPEEARRRQVLREAIEAERSGRAVADSHEDPFPSLTEVVSHNIEPHRANDDQPPVGHISTVVDQSTVGHISTVGTEPILLSAQAAAETTYTDLDAPTVVHRPPVGADSTGAYTPTVGNEALSHYLVSDGHSPTGCLNHHCGTSAPWGSGAHGACAQLCGQLGLADSRRSAGRRADPRRRL